MTQILISLFYAASVTASGHEGDICATKAPNHEYARRVLQGPTFSNLGKLILRASLGLMMLPHGLHKLQHGVDGISSMLTDKGLPSFIAWGVIVGEVVAPLFMIVGYQTRLAALVFAFNMAVATALAHASDIFSFSEYGAWKPELPMLYLFGALSVFLIGGGSYSVGRGRGRWD